LQIRPKVAFAHLHCQPSLGFTVCLRELAVGFEHGVGGSAGIEVGDVDHTWHDVLDGRRTNKLHVHLELVLLVSAAHTQLERATHF
jgi:hypothetical protein